MRRALLVSLSIGLLASLSAGCATAGDRIDDLRATDEVRDDVDEGTGRAGFCLSLTRAAAAIESGSPATAEEATEEALARAPDDMVEATRAVVELVREARDSGDWDPSDPELTGVVDQFEATARQHCAPE
jgi:hypothetical protein